MLVLVTGASGFAGSRLIPRLLSEGHRVRAFARDPTRVARTTLEPAGIMADPAKQPSPPGTECGRTDAADRERRAEIYTGDAVTGDGLERALRGVEVAYYLIHSMESSRASDLSPFPDRERAAAVNFATAAARADVQRLVYLGGPTASWTAAGDDTVLSPHLHSRETVEHILRDGVPDTVVLRASIVIGAHSRSFRFLVRLIERMPVLPLPPWRTHRTRPIDARDVIAMLAATATATGAVGNERSLDIGGPEILSYGEMIERIAELMLLARPAFTLGVNPIALTARVAAAIAEEDPALVGALMESLRGDLLPGGPKGQSYLHAAELLGVNLHSFDSAVERALREWESVEKLAAR